MRREQGARAARHGLRQDFGGTHRGPFCAANRAFAAPNAARAPCSRRKRGNRPGEIDFFKRGDPRKIAYREKTQTPPACSGRPG